MQPSTQFAKGLKESPECSNGNELRKQIYFTDTLINHNQSDLLKYWNQQYSECSVQVNNFNPVQVREYFTYNPVDNSCNVSLIKKVVGQDTDDINNKQPFFIDSRKILNNSSV